MSMIDASAGLGNLDTSALLPATQGVDASATDLSLRAIRHVESTWRMPSLPDAVRLDLASMPGGHAAVSSLLQGIDNDLNNNGVDDSMEVLPDLTMVNSVSKFNPEARSTFDSARVLIAGLRSEKAPSEVDDFAVQKWKKNAIEKGFLDAPADGVIDGSWDPSYNSIRADMAYSDYDSRARGYDRPGGIGLGDAMKVLGDWTSPSGLLRAATDLDLFWDFGQIGKEFSSWGDKWRKVGKSDGPLDFAKNLLDAVTGPIDDIAVPIINDVLLFAGVGEVMNFAKVGMLARGAEAAEALSEAGSVYRVPGISQFIDWAGQGGKVRQAAGSLVEGGENLIRSAAPKGDFAKFGDSSWLSSKLQGGAIDSLKIGGKSITDGLDAWRAYTPVKNTKKVVQLGMRLGIANQVERNILGYKGQGASLSDVAPIKSGADSLVNNAWISNVGEALFTPYAIFEPGSFMSGAKGLGSFAFKSLGSVPGRAVAGAVGGLAIGAFQGADTGQLVEDAAVGAAAGVALPGIGKGLGLLGHAPVVNRLPGAQTVGHVGDFLAKTSYVPLTNDQRLTSAFHEAVQKHLTGTDLEDYLASYNKDGFQKAFSERFTGGDTEAAGALMAYVSVSGAIDHTARLQAGAESGASFWKNYYIARDKLQAQLRVFHVGEGDKLEDVIWAAATKNSGNRLNMKRDYDNLMREATEEAAKDGVDIPARAAELANHHNIMAVDSMKQLLSTENLPDLKLAGIDRTNLAAWQAADAGKRQGLLANYIADVLPTFGDWTKYQPMVADLDSLAKDGHLLDARFKSAVGWNGRKRNLLTEFDEIPAPKTGITDPMNPDAAQFGAESYGRSLNDLLLRDPDTSITDFTGKGRFTPLARNLDTWRGKFTLMRKETVTKQELILGADELTSHADSLRDFERLNKKMVSRPKDISEAMVAAEKDLKNPLPPRPADFPASSPRSVWDLAGGNDFHLLADAQFTQGLKAAGVVDDDVKAMRRLRDYASKHGLTGGDFSQALNAHVNEVLSDARWTERFKLPTFMRDQDNAVLEGQALLRAKAKQLDEVSRRTAAEIDRDDLIKGLIKKHGENSPEVRRVTTVLDSLEAGGYKLVHGAEFLMPHDLLQNTGLFRDINDRHTNAMTVGNFFGRKQPEVLRAQVVKAQKAAILHELEQVPNHGLHLGKAADGSIPELDNVMHDLYDQVLTPAQTRSATSLSEVQHEAFLDRAVARYKTTRTPFSLQDLGLGVNEKLTVSKLTQAGYTEDAARAIWRGVKKGRYAEFKDLGLAAFEAKLRSRNQLTDALNVLGGTKEGSGWQNIIPHGKGAALVGAAVGAQAASGEDSDWGDILKGAALGAVGGKIGQAAIHSPLAKAAEVFDHSKWARYGYMADNLARMRDHFRFALNPFFDISRYTEGYFMAQTASPLKGLRINQSPHALKKQFEKEAMAGFADNPAAEGLGRVTAKEVASKRFNEVQAGFREAAKGHFDPQALESTGQWFKQVGIAGYDPTAWQASTWHHLKESGMDSETAYHHVKEMYTYGTTARSAAEQSVNFIFFPFSFQKQALQHAGKFLSDDLSRAVMLHDSYKMFHELDKRYDLGKFVQDHMPILEKLQQLNLFAFGISPGRMGGINAKLFDSAGGALLNLFSPQGVSIKNAAEAADLQKLVKSMIPAINDMDHLWQDTISQKNALTDPSWETRSAQARDGFKEWNDYKQGLYAALAEKGYKPSVLDADSNVAELAQTRANFVKKRAELAEKYPGWVAAKNDGIEKNVKLQTERTLRLDRAASGVDMTPDDLQFAQLEDYIARTRAYWKENDGITDLQDADPSVYDKIQGVAREMVRTNPNFSKIWSKFYARLYGPLEAPL